MLAEGARAAVRAAQARAVAATGNDATLAAFAADLATAEAALTASEAATIAAFAGRGGGSCAYIALGEQLIDVVAVVARAGFAAELLRCRFLCGETFRVREVGATAEAMQTAHDAQCGTLAARRAAITELRDSSVARARPASLMRAHPGAVAVVTAASRALLHSTSWMTASVAARAAAALAAALRTAAVTGSGKALNMVVMATERVAQDMANLSATADGETKLLACGAAPALVALASNDVVKGSAGAAQYVAHAMANLCRDRGLGPHKFLACGAAPVLVVLAGESVVKGSVGATQNVAWAIHNLGALPAAKAALVMQGAQSALTVLGAEPVVAASPVAAEWVGKARARLQ